MNRASGGARPAPPPPLIVAADAPSALQSDTPASAAETPDIPLAVSSASQDKEVSTSSAAAVRGSPCPSASLSLLHFFLHRTLTQTPDPNLNACLLQGILLCHVRQTHNILLRHANKPTICSFHALHSPQVSKHCLSCLTRVL
jgi:hypothetical protein